MKVSQALILAPSSGLGGGIERYLTTIEDAFNMEGITHHRCNLMVPGGSTASWKSHLALSREATTWLRSNPEPARIIVGHRSLLPTAVAIHRGIARSVGISVLLYGIDIWANRWRPELQLLRLPEVRPVAIGAFSAGTVGVRSPATLLSPALSRSWYETLKTSSARAPGHNAPLVVMTSFRLSEWETKGLATLVHALEVVGHPVTLRICGSGEPPQRLVDFISERPWIVLRASLADAELADELAGADLFVLATRTAAGRRASGEGFGLVLLEAQLAGTAVIAPAFGGGHDTFYEGLTGASPVDESVTALAEVIGRVLGDESLRDFLARNGRVISQRRFEPNLHSKNVVGRLL